MTMNKVLKIVPLKILKKTFFTLGKKIEFLNTKLVHTKD